MKKEENSWKLENNSKIKYDRDWSTGLCTFSSQEENQKLLEIKIYNEFIGAQLSLEWLNFLYEDAKRFHMSIEICSFDQNIEITIVKNHRKKIFKIDLVKLSNGKKRIKFYRQIKEWCRNQVLSQPAICALMTPGDMYEVGSIALESTLLSAKCWTISKQNGEFLETYIFEENVFPRLQKYKIEQRPIDSQRHATMWKQIEQGDYYLKINLTEDLLFKIQMISSINDEILEEITTTCIMDGLNNLELNLKNKQSRKMKPTEEVE